MKAKNVHVVNNMGKKISWIIIGVLSVLVIGAMFMFGLKKEKLTIRSLHFTYTSGYAMYAYTTYDIYLEDNEYYVTIKPYGVSEEESQTVKLDTKTINKLEKVLNEYDVSKWNNFHKSDKNVLDGDSFSFSMNTNTGKYISASGYMRWPKNYAEVKSALNDILGSLYEQKDE